MARHNAGISLDDNGIQNAFCDKTSLLTSSPAATLEMCIRDRDEDTVRKLSPDFDRLRKLEAGDGVIVTARGTDCDFVSRSFYPKCGVSEDPVTGSAHCNLIPYWADRLQKRQMSARQLSARGGMLYCQSCGERVKISGKAVLYAIAELCVSL